MYYEVVRIRKAKKDYNGFFSIQEGDEFYPSSESWGTYGWTFKTLEQAEAKFNNLTTTLKWEKER